MSDPLAAFPIPRVFKDPDPACKNHHPRPKEGDIVACVCGYHATGPRYPDTIPAPEVHPIPADVLEAWENGFPHHDPDEDERSIRMALAFLIRKATT